MEGTETGEIVPSMMLVARKSGPGDSQRWRSGLQLFSLNGFRISTEKGLRKSSRGRRLGVALKETKENSGVLAERRVHQHALRFLTVTGNRQEGLSRERPANTFAVHATAKATHIRSHMSQLL